MPEIVRLTSLNTELNADAVEWCPIPGLENLLACATYELVEDEEQDSQDTLEQHRRGYIYLFELQQDLSLNEVSKTETPGILDCKWSRHRIAGNVSFATVDAVCKVTLFKYDSENSILVELSCLDLSGDSNSLLLSLDWSNTLSPADDGCSIVASDSGGSVHVVSIAQNKLTLTSSRKAHEFEAWIAAYDYFNTSVFYSGGDDCKLKVHDTRVDLKTAVRTSNEHTAGVTSIQSNWLQEHSLITGSYDERLLFWDTRTMKRPQADIVAPGGVWRIKHDPFDCRLIACPCMYGGSVVVDSGLPTPTVIATYDFHKNINYGIDWCWKVAGGNENPISNLLAVCSFYDKLLSLAYLSNNTS
uniref:methylated diphthine methylhydrolase n=1 Tax=Lygus hesperus TaxID=30085 RepID=A0A0K8SH93_LYGHE